MIDECVRGGGGMVHLLLILINLLMIYWVFDVKWGKPPFCISTGY